ncbi:MAG: hypothetical protein ACREQF_11855 [Candidatus Binataceae bacterium]
MPRMNVPNQSIAANATSINLLAGLSYEFLPQAAHVVLALVAAAVGLNTTFLVSNGLTVVDDTPMSDANRFPVLPDDIMYEDDVPPGRLLLRVRNTTGGAIVFRGAIVDITFA